MEATQEQTEPEVQAKIAEANPEVQGPTAKEMAAAEELNAARLKAQADREQQVAEKAAEEPVSIIGLAAQGRDVLLDQLRQHAERTKKPEYVPPPRTERQMAQLEAELEAGRRSQARAQAQLDARPAPVQDVGKEGFTTPVYRPDNMVPDPIKGGMGPITEK